MIYALLFFKKQPSGNGQWHINSISPHKTELKPATELCSKLGKQFKIISIEPFKKFGPYTNLALSTQAIKLHLTMQQKMSSEMQIHYIKELLTRAARNMKGPESLWLFNTPQGHSLTPFSIDY